MADNDYFTQAGQQYGIDPTLLRAMAQVESGALGSKAVSPQGAYGTMQLQLPTAKEVGVTDPTNDSQAIPGAARYLVQGYQATGTPEGALMYYHGGPNQNIWGPKTHAYVDKVAAAYQALKGPQTAEADTGSKSDGSSAPSFTVFGDSLGQGIRDAGKFSGTTKVGATPYEVLQQIKAAPEISGPVILSSGVSNNPQSAELIQAQIDALKAKGVTDIRLVGVGSRPDLAPLNDDLAKLAEKNGVAFVGPVAAGKDGVHPGSYAELLKAAQTAAPPENMTVRAQAETAPTTTPYGNGRPSDADMAKLWGIGPSAVPTATAPAQAPAGRPSDADMAKLWGITPEAPAAAAPQIAAAPPTPISTGLPAAPLAGAPTPQSQAVGAGVINGAHALLDRPAEGLAYLGDKIGLNPLIGAPSYQQQIAQDAATREQYAKDYGGNPYAQAGSIGTQIAATMLPVARIGRAIGGVGNALLGTSLPARIATGAVSGAAQGAAGGGLTAGASGNPLLDQMKQGAEVGGALGAAGPIVGGVGGGIRNALVGGNTAPETAALAQSARAQGIPVTGAQISTSPFVHFADSVTRRLPFSGAGAMDAAQQTGFNRAVAKTIGETADRITPEVMSAARTRIGGMFDAVAAKSTIKADDKLVDKLGEIEHEASQTLPASEQAPLRAQIGNILEAATKGEGSISGETYQALTRKGAPLDRAMQSSDPNIKFYAGQIRDALDDALQRSAPQEALDQLKTARSQWKAMRTIEDLVEKSPTGDISPALLLGRVRSSYGNMAYDGGGQLGELARIGQRFLKEAPSSGTAERSLMHGMLFEAPAIAMGNPLLAAKIAGGIAAGRGVGSYLRSDFYTNMLLRNALAGPGALSSGLAAIKPGLAGAGQIALQRSGVVNPLVGQDNR